MRLINVQWRTARRYTRILRLNTADAAKRRITRVPYVGIKFREIKNSEIHLLARYTRQKVRTFLAGEKLLLLSFAVFRFIFASGQLLPRGGSTYYIVEM